MPPEKSTDSAEPAQGPRLAWDLGTAYDFFISLAVLHEPDKFGLRPSWAAGVRSRLAAAERKTLETAQLVEAHPMSWVYQLPKPKDAATALWRLRQTPPEQILPALTVDLQEKMTEVGQVLLNVAEEKRWDDNTLETLRDAFRQCTGEAPRPKDLVKILDVWAQPGEFGENYLAALQSYYEAFFAEEEQHISPALEESLQLAQDLAKKRALPDLLEQLSQGIRLEEGISANELVLVPSYWLAPLVIFTEIDPQTKMLVFGARPPDVSLVPGEMVPEGLLRSLKAVADPTRLRILNYLSSEPLTPSELARRLRLRAPTVTHHLHTLRLAGLVQVILGGEDRRYATRLEAIKGMHTSLMDFLQKEDQ